MQIKFARTAHSLAIQIALRETRFNHGRALVVVLYRNGLWVLGKRTESAAGIDRTFTWGSWA